MATEEAELTDEEKRKADQLLKDEQLKRSDPAAWERLQFQRQREALQVRSVYADEPEFQQTSKAPYPSGPDVSATVPPDGVSALAAALGQTASAFGANLPDTAGSRQGQPALQPIPGAGTRSGNNTPSSRSVSSRRSSVVRLSASLGGDATVAASPKVHSPSAAHQLSAPLENEPKTDQIESVEWVSEEYLFT
jgi:hypothetical protein